MAKRRTTGPRPSASAMQHASPNARFKRGTAAPTKRIGKLKPGFKPGSDPGRRGIGGFASPNPVRGGTGTSASGARAAAAVSKPRAAVPGSAASATGARKAPPKLVAPKQPSGNGPRKLPGRPVSGYQPNPKLNGARPSARAMAVASPNASFKRGSGETAAPRPAGVSGAVKKKTGMTTRPGKPVSIATGGVHTTAARR